MSPSTALDPAFSRPGYDDQDDELDILDSLQLHRASPPAEHDPHAGAASCQWSSLNDDDDDDDLGPGFGRTRAKLDDNDDVDPTGEFWGHEPSAAGLAESVSEGRHRFAPRRRDELESSGSGSLNKAAAAAAAEDGDRLSLAFELATASAQQTTRRRGGDEDRDLLSELGLVEDEGEDQEERSEDDKFDFDERSEGYGGIALDDEGEGQTAHALEFLGEQLSDRIRQSPRMRQAQIARSVPASSSVVTSASRTPDGVQSPSGWREDELEAIITNSALELETSSSSSREFLSRLEQLMQADEMQSAVDWPGSTRAPPPAIDRPARLSDRQHIVEELTSRLVNTIQDVTQTRARQVLELSEVERALSRPDPSWRAALGQLDPFIIENDCVSNQSPLGAENDSRLASVLDTALLQEFDGPSPSPPTGVHSTPMTGDPDHLSLVVDSFASLRLGTSSAISTLTSLHEMVQVQQAATSDWSRKLRALRGHLTSLMEDMESAQRGEDYVERWERGQRIEDGLGPETRVGRGTGSSGRWAREAQSHAVWAETRLEEGWTRAQDVLGAASRLASVQVQG